MESVIKRQNINLPQLESDINVDLVSRNLIQYLKSEREGFEALNDRLLSKGHISSGQLVERNGLVLSNCPKDGSKKLEIVVHSNSIYKVDTPFSPPLEKPKSSSTKTLGKGWFNLQPAEVTDELKRDMKIIQMRNALDPKRFYKKPDKIKSALHIGTVIEGPSEYKSARLSRKERKGSILEEVLSSSEVKNYSKRKYQELQNAKSKKVKMFKTKSKRKENTLGDARREKLRKTLIK